jgi:hypothetical protein
VGSDDLIGTTKIDIENRWLNEKWKVAPFELAPCASHAHRVAGNAQEAPGNPSLVFSCQPNAGVFAFIPPNNHEMFCNIKVPVHGFIRIFSCMY